MRCSFRFILVVVNVALLMQGTAKAQWQQQRPANTKTRQSVAAPRPRPDGSSMAQQTVEDEQQILGWVRSYQLQLQREEKLLAQRMAEAAKLRERGLQQRDQRLLQQAEQYERRALAAYQQRVQQFEQRSFDLGTQQPAAKSPTNSRPSPPPGARTQQSTKRVQRSTSNTNPWRRWYPSDWR
ncbi:MAG: hypothetical protein A2W31_00425 [Planctomycetes bacterium RBG_16_64_10]|nr:MAG: hypothetical protein A2W31_00425 [Planctomycetes bacterium RBG_16_64_10]